VKFDKLTESQVERFIQQLKDGLVWSNNLVGRQTYYYEDGRFVSLFQDIREPEYGPFVKEFSEDEFREMLREQLFPSHVHLSLTWLLDQ
jgi:hypothetical protein